MPHYVWIALGSAIGGMARYWMGTEIVKYYGASFPWATLVINVLGSFAIGVAVNWAEVSLVRYLLIVGICGGFTTFSSFSLESVALLRQGAWQKGLAYILASVTLCVAATFLGSMAGRAVPARPA
ncbi:MAG TPA: fluoride efflux transporter CrcB [Bryobacteraceae bacterium]|nr:fluoride efflux transporter CrcB [Bryobacteraceae bacterium]